MGRRFGSRAAPGGYVRRIASAVLACGSLLSPAHALSDDTPEFLLKFRDGVIEPLVTTVPADQRIKLVLINEGKTPIEFESIELRKEKVVGPGVTTFIVIRRLDAGEHTFFDDFHPQAPQARLIATEEAP